MNALILEGIHDKQIKIYQYIRQRKYLIEE